MCVYVCEGVYVNLCVCVHAYPCGYWYMGMSVGGEFVCRELCMRVCVCVVVCVHVCVEAKGHSQMSSSI